MTHRWHWNSLVMLLLLQSCGDSTGLEDDFGVASVRFTTADPVTLRQGDVAQYAAEVLDAFGAVVADAEIIWSVEPQSGGFTSDEGHFVGYSGTPLVIASAGTHADTLQVTITARSVSGTFSIVGQGEVLDRITSDLWVHGNAAYTGTRAGTLTGNTLNTWDIRVPGAPALVDFLMVDAGMINDVKVSEDGTLGVITHEGSASGGNGITLLDLTDPLAPAPIVHFTTTLESGVHNAWIDGTHVYLAVNGTNSQAGLRILNVADPAAPAIVADFYGGSSFVHDIYVRDGLTFLSHWNAGLIILDVGNGMAGGSPANPVEVSRLATQGGQTHNAWYWLAGGYVFVGEEDFETPGIMHVVDVSDISNPREVATFAVSGATPHNFWMDETAEILYLSWYSNGIRALDVSGQLLGALDQQGREIAGFLYAQAAGAQFSSMNWAPQFHNGLLYLSDMNTGLWILQPNF